MQLKSVKGLARLGFWAAVIAIAAVSTANALVLRVEKQGDKGDVLLRVGMSNEDYSAAAGLMGGQNQVVDSSIPGENDVNVALPLTKEQYDRMRTNAAQEASAGPDWCITCDKGGAQITLKAINAFKASLLGTKQCESKAQSPNLSVLGPGSCAQAGN